ncbi:MAG: restriction endonuclease subunit S, partial [Deltaproteobacteria bacterium]|nr:restriction endonuclease subunit S [Deltaproteobacteria bacterium]
KEKRQAVISHAVTKGLNPDVPMKDSGVEWIGEVPVHWGITRLKNECINIVDCLHSTPDYTDDGRYPAIRTADISSGKLDVDNARKVTAATYRERNIRLVPAHGDIIYSREGERFGLGATVPEGANVCLGQRVMLFRAKETPGFLMWALNAESTYRQAQQDVIGSTSPHVNVETIKNFCFAWPPMEEREQIAAWISTMSDKLEKKINTAPLGARLDDAIALWGEADEYEESDEYEDTTV